MNSGAPAEQTRPRVSVIVPFAGDPHAADQAAARLNGLRLRAGDEILIVDNSGRGAVQQPSTDIRVIRASHEQSAYYARNVGAAAATGEWLLFLDADCVPPPDLVERYFAAPIADRVGAVVGEVKGARDQTSLVSRYARSRRHLEQELHWNSDFRPWGVTANLLVRKRAWASIGGFQEGVRSGGDAEFSWRLQDAGWELEYRPAASVWHEHRDTVRKLVRQAGRYGAGRGWLMQRYPQGHPRPVLLRQLLRSVAGIAVWSTRGQFERAAFKALDGLYVTSEWLSFWLLSNRPPSPPPRAASIGYVAAAFPTMGTREDGPTPESTHIEALRRPLRIDLGQQRALSVAYAEDEGGVGRVLATARLLIRAPRLVVGSPRSAFRIAGAARRLQAAGVRSLSAMDDDPSTRDRLVLLRSVLDLHQEEITSSSAERISSAKRRVL